jgi:hypothetical protein
MIYLLTEIGLSPGGSTHLHTNNTQNNTNNNRTTQITTNVEECGPCPVFASFTLAFALELRKKCMDTVLKLLRTQGTTAKLTIVQKNITVQNICAYLPIKAGEIFKVAVCCQDYTERETDKCGKVM